MVMFEVGFEYKSGYCLNYIYFSLFHSTRSSLSSGHLSFEGGGDRRVEGEGEPSPPLK